MEIMKMKYIFTLLAAAMLFASCTKDEIDTYNKLTTGRYLSFASTESTVAFSRYPGQQSVEYPVIVNATGYSENEMEYKISVVADSTTAQAADYAIPASFVMPAKCVADTFYVTLNYSEKLDAEEMRLTLKVEPNEYFQEGETKYAMTDIMFHNFLVKPDWWTSTVTTRYLGTFSELKYKHFLQVVQVDLSDADNSTIRHYALIFKAWLAEQAAAGNTITEANGTPMTVPAGGNF